MTVYHHILCATDFSSHSQKALERATTLARLHEARLTLLHIVEYFPEDIPVDVVYPEALDLESYLAERARKRLAEIAGETGLEAVGQEVRVSARSARHEIVGFAEEQDVDLIVVASHGRHWIDALLGSTASGVLRHAPCDVLAVRSQT